MNRGSEWRIWDLHFHTPSSYDYKNKSITNQQLVDGLVNNGVSAVAITDHFIIDVARITELQNIGKEKGLTVFPGIEFCSELGGNQAIHFIAIFSPESNLSSIWTKIQGQCNLTPSDIEQKGGYEKICCTFVSTCKLIQELGGLVSVHGGSKSNSLEEIKNNLLCKQEIKTQLLTKFNPILDCGKPSDTDNYKKNVFPNIGFSLPVIISSDNHNIKDYTVKCKTWIKADTTFKGLQQILYEPTERVCLSETIPELKKSYSVIDHIELHEDDENIWNQNVYLNQNLNAIIGGRSTGKSNLISSIAANLAHDSEGQEDAYTGKIKKSVKIVWGDGLGNEERKIEYFPQNYIYSLADKREELDKLLLRTILGQSNFQQLYDHYKSKCSECAIQTSTLLNQYFDKLRICDDQKKLIQSFGDIKGIEIEIKNLKKEKKQLEERCKVGSDALKKFDQAIAKLNQLTNAIEQLSAESSRLISLKEIKFIDINPNLSLFGLSESHKAILQETTEKTILEANNSICKVLDSIITEVSNSILAMQIESEKVKCSKEYIEGKEFYENNKSLAEYSHRLQEQEKQLSKITVEKDRLNRLQTECDNTFVKMVDSHLSYLSMTKEIANGLHMNCDDINLVSHVTLSNNLQEMLENSINLQSREMVELVAGIVNSYSNLAIEPLKEKIKHIIVQATQGKLKFKRNYEVKAFLNTLLETNWYKLTFDAEYDGDSLLKMSPGKRAFVVLKLLLEFGNVDTPILIDQPEDNLDNRAIYQDLVSYIRKKKKTRQIILVTHNPNIVVGADAENIIVANQNGLKTPNNQNRKFQYVNGSLENSFRKKEKDLPILETMGIREHVCEILEGGEQAFKERENKYGFGRI